MILTLVVGGRKVSVYILKITANWISDDRGVAVSESLEMASSPFGAQDFTGCRKTKDPRR